MRGKLAKTIRNASGCKEHTSGYTVNDQGSRVCIGGRALYKDLKKRVLRDKRCA